jgi:hypothetical protein
LPLIAASTVPSSHSVNWDTMLYWAENNEALGSWYSPGRART